MQANPFTLYRRYSKRRRRNVYYVQFRDADSGKRSSGICTYQTDKNKARAWSYELLKNGLKIEKSNMKFSQYAEKWFVYDECKYIQRKLHLNHGYSERCAEYHRSNLDHYILPFFKGFELAKIKKYHVEDFRDHLMKTKGVRGKILGPKTINNIVSTLSVMMGEASRLDYIPKDPTKGIGKLSDKNKKRKSCLTDNEFRALFDPTMIEFIWKDLKHYTLNLLAALNGLRQGECQGLTIRKVYSDKLYIDQAWHRKTGMGDTKTRATTAPPISEQMSELFQQLIKESPYKDDPDSLIFYGKDAYTPVDHKTILETLYAAFEKIGITDEERRERNITFHSWRHFFVTNGRRNGVPDAIIRAAVGHKTLAMTENYTQIQTDHMHQIQQMQNDMFPGVSSNG